MRLSQRELRWRHPRWTGPFGFQPNNTTRVFEYPWAFHAVPVGARSPVVEIGGSLSGFQFVMAKSGAAVTNVDPGLEARGLGWPVDAGSIGALNRAFGTDVTLVNTTLEEAGLEDESADAVYSISTIEHIPTADLPSLMKDVRRILRPGGACVLTIDLFLDLVPFTTQSENEFGTNVSVLQLVESSELDLVVGRPEELFGFPQFDADAVRDRLDDFLVGVYPTLAQCVVLGK